MPIKSLYPSLPELPEINIHYALLRRPDQAEWPDFPVHIDAKTGETRSFREFVERVEWAATALGAPVEEGGLGLSAGNGDIIGIMSENCMVSSEHRGPFLIRFFLSSTFQDYITFAHACWHIATPFAPISSYSKPFELRHALTLAKVTCLFIDEKFLSMALPVAKEVGLPSKRIFVVTGHAQTNCHLSSLTINTCSTSKINRSR